MKINLTSDLSISAGCILFTRDHITEAHGTEGDEGVVNAVQVVPGPRAVVLLQSREDGGRYEHQERSEEEDEDDGLHQDHHNLGTSLCRLSPA